MPFKKPHLSCGLSELDYSDRKIIQNDIAYDYQCELLPRNTIIANNPLVFQIEPGNDFVDLGRTQLKLTLSIADATGANIAEGDVAGPINNFANSLFSQVSVSLKNNVISHPNPNYAYKSYFDNLLNFSGEAKKTWLTYEGFYKDQADKFDANSNTGLLARQALFASGRKCQVVTRLHCDINFQRNLIPSNLDITYILTPARQQFVMQSFSTTKTYNIKIDDAKLCVRKIKLHPERALTFERSIAKEEIRLPISYVRVNTYTLPQGIKSYEKNGLFTGALPEICVFGLVDNAAYTGSFTTNPFNFKPFDLSQAQFVINGRACPTQPPRLDYGSKNVFDGYSSLYHALGRHFTDSSNDLSVEDYCGGTALYAICLNSNTNCSHDDVVAKGAVDVNLKFDTALPNAVTLICYSSTESTLLIGKYHNVILEG